MQKKILNNHCQWVLLVLLSILFFPSCRKIIYASLQKDLDLKAIANPEGQAQDSFVGLKYIFEDLKHDTTDILLIHGVRSQKPSHFRSLIDTLAERLECDFKVKESINITSGATVDIYGYQGENQKFLRFYNIHWSPITDSVKEAIYTSLDDIPNRTVMSRKIKQKFLIDVFADLALYLGNYRSRIQTPVDSVLNRMRESPTSKKVLITGSFGSQIVLDVLIRQKKTSLLAKSLYSDFIKMAEHAKVKDDIDAKLIKLIDQYQIYQDSFVRQNIDVYNLVKALEGFQQEFARVSASNIHEETITCVENCTKVFQLDVKIDKVNHYILDLKGFYMLSNQLPFTSLMELDPKTSPANFVDHIYQDLAALLEDEEKNLQLKIVSFYDPNDVFGYRLPQPKSNTHLKIVNVEVYNTVPFYFDPDALRKKYLSSPNINGALQELVRNSLRQGVDSQSLVIDIDESNDAAKNNPTIINHLFYGDRIPGVSERFKTITRVYKKNRISPPKTQIITYQEEYKTNKKINVIYEEPKGFRNFVSRLALRPYLRQIKKMDIKRSYLANELPKESIHFSGLQEALQKCDTVHILTMHGMVSKSPEHFDDMIHRIRKTLNFNEIPESERWQPVEIDPSLSLADSAQIKIVEYGNNKGQILCFYVVYWSPLTSPPKQLLKDIDNSFNMADKRSALPTALKNTLINDGFCDVTLSLRTYRPLVDRCLKEAFNIVKANASIPNDPTIQDNESPPKQNIFFISGSLGSKLLFDYLSSALIKEEHTQKRNNSSIDHISRAEHDNALQIIKRLHTFFMLSNQLPLISIRDLDDNSLEQLKNSKNFNWKDHIYNNWGKLIDDSIRIVAFYDPNDVLGFPLQEEGTASNVNIINVPLNLAGGYDVNLKPLLKFTTKVDKVLAVAFLRRKDFDSRKEWKAHKALIPKLNLLLTPNLLPYLDYSKPRQTFVIDFLKAHEGGKKDKRVIEMISFGTDDIKKRKETTP